MSGTPTREVSTPASEPAPGRVASLDVLRVAVIVMVIVHHAAQPYGPTGGQWPVTDPAQSDWFRPFYTVNAAVGLGLLFLLAGWLVPGSYDRKGPRRFARQRWTRLGVPLVAFAVAANIPIAVAAEQPSSPGALLGYLYANAWTPLYLHLWFVGQLLLYSAAYVLWRSRSGRAPRTWPLPGSRSILAFTVGLVAVTWVVRWWYPVDAWVPLLWVVPAEPAHLPQYVSLFVLGVMAFRGDWLPRLSSGVGRMWLGVGLAGALGMVAVQTLAPGGWRYNALADGGLNWQSLVRATLEALICVGLAVGLPVVLRDAVHRPLRLVSAMAAASFGAYILHIYLLVPMQAAITGVDASPFLKFAVVAVLGVLLSFGAAHLSERAPGIRRLLGAGPSRAPDAERARPGSQESSRDRWPGG